MLKIAPEGWPFVLAGTLSALGLAALARFCSGSAGAGAALATLAAVGLAILSGVAATRSSSSVSLWADISLIWLIIPMMFMALVIMALVIALVYGLNRLLKVTPHYTGLAQYYTFWFNAQVTIWTDKLVKPVLFIKSWLGSISKHEE